MHKLYTLGDCTSGASSCITWYHHDHHCYVTLQYLVVYRVHLVPLVLLDLLVLTLFLSHHATGSPVSLFSVLKNPPVLMFPLALLPPKTLMVPLVLLVLLVLRLLELWFSW